MGTEVEVKLLAPKPEVLGEVRTFLSEGTWHTTHISTSYFDLSELGEDTWVLRERHVDGSLATFALKLPGAGYARPEFECTAPSIQAALPMLVGLGAPAKVLDLTHFTVTCGTRFARSTCNVIREGARIEVALDEGAVLAGAAREPLAEVELELKAGPIEPLLALRDELASRFGLMESHVGKYQRARALAKGLA